MILQVLQAIEGDTVIPAQADPDQLHRLTEALKHAFADRANLMGDPDWVRVPIGEMLSARRTAEIRSLFHLEKTLEPACYGGRYAAPADAGTSHFNVVDSSALLWP